MSAVRRVAHVARNAAKRCRASPVLFPTFLSRASRKPPAMSDTELTDLVRAVSDVSEHDLAIHKDDFVHATTNRPGAISYVSVAEDDDLLMAVFVMPPGSSIPLHDHHHMSVVSRVLWGELEVQSYDLLGSSWSKPQNDGLAVKHHLNVTKAGEVTALTPSSGNIHSFHATEWTAVFDVLVPPYNEEEGRECRYYAPLDLDDDAWSFVPSGDQQEAQERVFLKEVQCPDSYHTVSVPYRGMPIDE